MTKRLRDCPFCGNEIGYSDLTCPACGEENLPMPDEVEDAMERAEQEATRLGLPYYGVRLGGRPWGFRM